jgi:hypothetical protein
MSNPQQETKIELVTEAIEALVLAQVVAVTHGGGPHFHEQVLIARTGVHDALKELLQPVLRIASKTDRIGNLSVTHSVAEIRAASPFPPENLA